MEIIKLNLIPNGVNPTCHCSQYDNGRVIRIDLFDGLTPYVLQSGDTVTLNVRKPDNTIIETSLTATQGNTYVNLVTTEQMCACVGYNLCDLTITNGSVVIGTLNFIMQVERDVLADGIPSQSVIEDLDALVQEAVGDNYYTKTEVDTALDLKADKSTTYTKTEVDTALSSKANSSDVYTKSQTDAALNDISEKVDYMIEQSTDPVSTDIASSELFTKYPEGSSIALYDTDIYITTLDSMDTYFLVAPRDCSLYFGDSLPAYAAICHGVAPWTKDPDSLIWACNSAVRYRNIDNNLPSSSSPLSVSEGDIITITITKDTTATLYGLESAYSFTDNAKEQIRDITNIKQPLITRSNIVDGNIVERAYIYIPQKVGYVKYDFVHYVNANTNADTWNINPVYAVDDNLTNRFQITTEGEFECAIKISDAPDFMGGMAHGSEVKTSIQFILDGKPINLSEVQPNTVFNELRVVEISNLYDPSDETTIAAEHSKEYIFNKDGVTINQFVNWKGSYTLSASYMSMFPTAKTAISYLRVNNKINTYDLSQNMPSIESGVKHAYSWGSNILCDFDIPVWDINAQTSSQIGRFDVLDNGGLPYYKMYFRALDSGTVANGDTWQTTTFYNIQVGA